MNRVSRLVSFVLLTAIVLSLVVVQCIPCSIDACAVSDFDDGKLIVVSLGDSYSSGEGIEPFYGQNKEFKEKIKDDNWLAHRSELSWAGRIHIAGMPEGKTLNDYNVDAGKADADSSIQWYFRASSGAKTWHLSTVEQQKVVKRWGFKPGEFTVYCTQILPKMRCYKIPNDALPTQLSVFDDYKLNGKVDFVTLTIGGNNVDFAGIIKQCATESSYQTGGKGLKYKLAALWYGTKKTDSIVETREKIRQTYKKIEEKAGKQATIIVAGYPKLLDAEGKGALFSKQEAAIVNCAVTKFNYILHSVVEECQEEGMKIVFVDVEDIFDTKDNKGRRHQVYSGDAWLNPIMALQDQDLDHSNPISDYSVHPNDKGAAAYAACINKAIFCSDSTGHWHACSGHKYKFDESELTDVLKEIVNGENRTVAEKCNDKVCFSPHTYGEWIFDKSSANSSTWKKYRKCTVCGYEDVSDASQGGNIDPKLIGKWFDENGFQLSFEDGVVGTDSVLGKFICEYNVSGDKIILVDDTGRYVETLTYKIDGDTLTLYRKLDDGGVIDMVFTRSGSGEPAGYIPPELLGTWVTIDDSFAMTFTDDGRIAEGPNYTDTLILSTYTVSGNTIYRTYEDGERSNITYELGGDVLTLHYKNGNVVTYYRKGSGGGGGSGGGSVEGDWVVTDSDGRLVEGLLVTFHNGKETIYAGGDSRSYSYRVSGNLLTVTHETSDAVYRFEVSGNKMYFYSPDDGDLWISFKRK